MVQKYNVKCLLNINLYKTVSLYSFYISNLLHKFFFTVNITKKFIYVPLTRKYYPIKSQNSERNVVIILLFTEKLSVVSQFIY